MNYNRLKNIEWYSQLTEKVISVPLKSGRIKY